ncbi:hypothetical protein BCR33DRAFT_474478 [Rhizoclosmatium globosum]|uniref:Integrase core domain-containing protein n=1 Tax=Rhizoclosmatium globosum TaxID=329046 RepID=A0A1Y2BPF8_9FUNG|nr:hypothetical protein BCR33DRAFT_474478 [Rhizoclosmatium globosum]|eukprot:ORY36634.1 hypothetical protein BCR33DRAFT_474478 [Rhizoclosmatium globosum]
MLEARGAGRGSIIAGRSNHNQRIERMNLDLRKQVLSTFENTFYDLEESRELSVHNSWEVWVLHQVYTPRIQEKLDWFIAAHNNSKKRMHQQMTPRQIFELGVLMRRGTTPAGQEFDSSLIQSDGIERFGEDNHTRHRAARYPETVRIPDGVNFSPYERKYRARVNRVKCPLSPDRLVLFNQVWMPKFRNDDGNQGKTIFVECKMWVESMMDNFEDDPNFNESSDGSGEE